MLDVNRISFKVELRVYKVEIKKYEKSNIKICILVNLNNNLTSCRTLIHLKI